MENSNNLPTSLDSASPSVDSSRPNSSRGFLFFKSRCAICLDEMRKEDGKAIFTAECSHSFHFECITKNVQFGNKICPSCRTEWKQVPSIYMSPPPTFTAPAAQAQRGFEDDEFLPHGETQIRCGSGVATDREAVEITLFPEVSAVAKGVTRNDFAVLVHLKAEEGVNDDDNDMLSSTRAPLDLITVLDVSGSMVGSKLELMKNAMGFVIQNLGEKDRLSIVSFSHTAQRVFPLRLMNETGKLAAMEAVNSLAADGGTNIADGLKIGARVIEDRRWKNPVSGMMLLSDGQDNYTFSHHNNHNRLRTDYESLLPNSSRRIPVHTFGFGSDHDAELMHTISQVSSGTFSFIETETVIQDAFAQCIGGLLSVVILEQVVEIECVNEQGLKISSIKSGSYRNRVSSDKLTAKINVGDMYAEEERDFLVMLEIPRCDNESPEPVSMPLLNVRCVYKDPVAGNIVYVESPEVTIQRPKELTGEEVVSIEVNRQLNRFLVSQAMSEARDLADRGDLSAAAELLKTREREVSDSPSARANDSLSQSLSTELNTLQERMASQRMYQASGRAYALSSMSSHSAQRASAYGGGRAGGCSMPQAYQTSPMSRMVTRSQELGIKSPKPSPSPASKDKN